MCLILVGVNTQADRRIRLLANRDEFHERPSAAAAPWDEDARIVGGRDLRAGGSWLAARDDGRFVAVTNVRRGEPVPAPRSRGDLVRGFVAAESSAEDWLAELLTDIDEYAPFNLVLGDAHGVVAFDGIRRQLRPLDKGWHAISNGPLDDDWPKMRRIRALAEAFADADAPYDEWLMLLRDRERAPDDDLPDTGFALERERVLSSIFILGDTYGTRASTLLDIASDGRMDLIEQRFGPHGMPAGRDHWRSSAHQSGWLPIDR